MSIISCYSPQSEWGEGNPGCVFEDLVGVNSGVNYRWKLSPPAAFRFRPNIVNQQDTASLCSAWTPTHVHKMRVDQEKQLRLPENCTETTQKGLTVHTSHVSRVRKDVFRCRSMQPAPTHLVQFLQLLC